MPALIQARSGVRRFSCGIVFRSLLAVGLVACVAKTPVSAQTQTYPSRPLKIVVPSPPGGGVDLVARSIGSELTRRIGQPVVVDNRPGAGGNIGTEFVAKSAPDGYTLLLASMLNVVNPSLQRNLSWNTKRDFMPVSQLAAVPSVLLAGPSLSANTIADLVALARANPGRLSYAASGQGSSEFLAAELFRSLAGIDMLHVNYKGGAPALTDLIGGQTSMMFVNLLIGLPLIQGGKLRALGVADDRRSSVIPDVPTFAEAGYAEMRVAPWFGLLVPAGTSPDIIGYLSRETASAAQAREFQEVLRTRGGYVLTSTPEQFGEFLDRETARWGALIKATGASAD